MMIVRLLVEKGHTAYFAGGCVRDRIMGRMPQDYDVATDAPPEKVREIFRVTRAVGQAFGVIMVRMNGVWVEVATFRTEWGYNDHRHPDHVIFSDAEHDARRRDFTINGLFYDPLKDQVIDYVGGRLDIAAGVIRAIGDPRKRFEEDYLRMLRAVRFSSRYEFLVEAETAAAIRERAGNLTAISRERIGAEVQMMLEHPKRAAAMELLAELGLDAPTLGETTIARPCAVMAGLKKQTDPRAALAAWALDRHVRPDGSDLPALKAVQLARRWRESIVLSNEHHQGLEDLLRGLRQTMQWAELSKARKKRLLSKPNWPLLAELCDAAVSAWNIPREYAESEIAELRTEGVDPTPLITGDDLTAGGFAPGPRFKTALDLTYDAQLEGRIHTKKEAMEMAGRILRGED